MRERKQRKMINSEMQDKEGILIFLGVLSVLCGEASELQKMLAVVLEFVDRFVNVRQRLVLAMLGEAGRKLRLPALHELLQRAHIEIAVMKERFEPRQMPYHETAVLMHRIATHRRHARRNKLLQKLQHASLHVGFGQRRSPDAI